MARLRRVRNILNNPQAALLVDHYEKDWNRLWYLLVTGTATLLTEAAVAEAPALNPNPGPRERRPDRREDGQGEGEDQGQAERREAIRRLREKYPQYRNMAIDANPVIRLTPQRAIPWDAAV